MTGPSVSVPELRAGLAIQLGVSQGHDDAAVPSGVHARVELTAIGVCAVLHSVSRDFLLGSHMYSVVVGKASASAAFLREQDRPAGCRRATTTRRAH